MNNIEEAVNHFSRAKARSGEASPEDYPLVLAQLASAAATLALAGEQRTANLIAFYMAVSIAPDHLLPVIVERLDMQGETP